MKTIKCILLVVILCHSHPSYGQSGNENRQTLQELTGSDQAVYNQVLSTALIMQLKADSAARTARDKRILSMEIPDAEMKNQLKGEIRNFQHMADSLQGIADALFTRARTIKSDGKNAGLQAPQIIPYKSINGITIFQYITNFEKANPEKEDDSENRADNPVGMKDMANTQGNSEKKENFQILDHSPYSLINPFQDGLDTLQGLIYRVQLGVFGSRVEYDTFDGISPVYMVKENNGLTKYFAGLFYESQQVLSALEQIRNIGFPDAFVVAFFNGNPISTEKAREIEYARFKL